MNKQLLLPVCIALVIVLQSPVIVSASPPDTVHHVGKNLWITWPLGDQIELQLIVNWNTWLDRAEVLFPNERTVNKISMAIWTVDYNTNPPAITIIHETELLPREFTWSMGGCRISTEIDGCPLIVVCDIDPPTQNEAFNIKNGEHIAGSHSVRYLSATVVCGFHEPMPIGVGGISRVTGNHVYE